MSTISSSLNLAGMSSAFFLTCVILKSVRRIALMLLLAGAVLMTAPSPVLAADTRLQNQLDALVKAEDGPPGAIVTLRRGSHTKVLTAGVADTRTRRPPRARDHMRIASVAKAFSGAVALRLVAEGKLQLGDTIGRRCCPTCRARGRR